MKKIYLILVFICINIFANGQTTTIYAGGGLPSTDAITGYASTLHTSYISLDSIVSDGLERGYAVFDLGTIPALATITGVVIGYNIAFDTVIIGTASGWNIYGFAGDLSLVASEATLYADCIAGTSLYTGSWGSGVGNQTQPSNATAVSFISGHIGSKISMCFTSAGFVRYGFTGESGTATTSGAHAPYLQITYTCPPISPRPNDTVCLGSTLSLTDSIGGGSWSSAGSGIASIDSFGVVSGSSSGTTTISYDNLGCVSTVNMDVLSLPAIIPSSALSICANTTTTLSNSMGGGTWSSGSPGIASVNSSGVVTGVSNGVATITYTHTTCTVFKTITVTGPVAISPTSASVCIGGSTTYTDATGGGTWAVTNSSASVSGSGVVTGLSLGTDTLHYTALGCTVSATINVTSGTASITPAGPVTICTGTTATLADATGGGSWGTSSSAIATVSGGTVTGIGPGVATITYSVGSCYTTKMVTVSAGPVAVSPASATVCIGNTVTLADATGGGTWTSSGGAATVTSGGVVAGIFAGSVTISYSIGSCSSTASITVSAGPAAITPAGPVSVCTGATVTLSDATGGGIWTSGTPGTATVSSSGVVSGVTGGTVTISYSVAGCYVTKLVTVNSGAAAIAPSSATICTGDVFTFSDATGGGAWTSGTPGVASVTAFGGVVTGNSTGTATISYTVGTCSATASVTVSAGPAAITPSGAIAICAGTTVTLSDATGGGTWTSGSTGVATVSLTGVVTGVGAGTATISYAVGSCTVTKLVTVSGSVAAISPSSATICNGYTFTFTDATGGGIWTTGAPSIATVSGGVVTGASAGTTLISYTVGSCTATVSVSVNNAPYAVVPFTSLICQGTTETLTDVSGGGTWSSSSAGIASVTAGGLVTGVSSGVATISYSVGTCSAMATVTVNAAPAAISPASTIVCVGSSVSLSETVGGGTWASSAPGIATVSTSGLVTGAAIGNATISYSIGSCSATATVTVQASASAGTITGPTSICGTGTATLSDPAPGGSWSASNSHATVSSGGVVTGVTTGNDIISYTVGGGCGTISATFNIAIDSAPYAGVIYGPSSICAGSFTILADSSAGGAWSVTNSTAAISGTGILTGLTVGVDTVVYTVSSACGGTSTTKVITVNPLPVTGTISGSNTLCVPGTITLSETATGGIWGRTNTHASVSGTGVVTGVSGGLDTILYSVTNSCGTFSATWPITVNTLSAGTITGPSSVCGGSLITLVDLTTGGSFSSSNSNATVIPATGVLSGVSAGIDTITYTVINSCGLATAIKIITVDAVPIPAGIAGSGSVCLGGSITMTDATPGGTWSRTNSNVSVTGAGVVTGLAVGTDTILYTIINSCGTGFSSAVVVVSTTATAGSISGGPAVCVGSDITLSDGVTGGTWSASNADATVSSTGIVTGVSAGIDLISYTVVTGCGTAVTIIPITVNAYPTAGVISGSSLVCQGAAISLTESIAGGTWSSGDTSVAIILSTGVVTGVTTGTDTISYTIVNSCSTVGTFLILSVMPLPDTGTITGLTSVCVGSTITLSDAIPGGTWSCGNANATVDATGDVTGISEGNALVSYSVTNSCGTLSAVSNIAVVVFPVTGVITGPSTVCVGANITLADADTGGAWVLSNLSATIGSTGIMTGVAARVDSVFYTITNACGMAQSNTTITINPSPVVGAVSGVTGICAGSNTLLTDTTAGGSWSSSNTLVGAINASTGLLTGSSAGIDTVYYSVSNGFGCTVSATIVDTIYAIPVTTPVTGSKTICQGATSTLANSISMGTWSSGNMAVATVTSSTGIVTGISVGSAIITYSVLNICGSVTDTTTVTVTAMPVVAPISGTTMTVCAGTTTQVTDATGGGTWSSSNTTIATVGSATGMVTGSNPGTVTITYTVSNSSGCSAYATYDITFGSSIGSSYVTPSNGTICTGHTLSMQVITAGTLTSYQWMRNGVNIAGATNYNYTANLAGSYSVVISNGSCQETLTGTIVSVLTVPVVTFTSPVFSTGAYTSYQWYRNGIAIPGATNSTYIEHAAGSYKVVVNDGTGCSDTSASHVVSGGGGGGGGTAVANITNPEISFYPNPATMMIHIDAQDAVNVKILSPDGRVVIEQNEALDVNISTLASGMYIIMIYDKDNLPLKTGKFMKL